MLLVEIYIKLVYFRDLLPPRIVTTYRLAPRLLKMSVNSKRPLRTTLKEVRIIIATIIAHFPSR